MFASNRSQIPTGIWVLGFVSLLMDVSSEMIHSLLPLFMVTSLGASALMIGLIEGLAEATALIVKVFSGVLSDWFGRRKGLALIGYGCQNTFFHASRKNNDWTGHCAAVNQRLELARIVKTCGS